MITRHRKPLTRIAAAVLVVLALAAGVLLVRQNVFRPTTITAYFTSATAIYPGDEVRVAGVKVGTITTIEPAGSQARLTLAIDHGVPVRADAKAIIMAQNLVASGVLLSSFHAA